MYSICINSTVSIYYTSTVRHVHDQDFSNINLNKRNNTSTHVHCVYVSQWCVVYSNSIILQPNKNSGTIILRKS